MTGGKADVIGFEELERHALKFETERKLEDARDAFDSALKLNPSSQSAAEGRARVALALREEGALEHCSRALKFHDDRPERQLLMISTVAANFGSDAIPLFEDYLRRNPQSAEAHERFAELRAERGDEDRFMDGFVQALANFP